MLNVVHQARYKNYSCLVDSLLAAKTAVSTAKVSATEPSDKEVEKTTSKPSEWPRYYSLALRSKLVILARSVKALANEDTLLPTQMFPRLPARATFVADTNFVSGTQKMFLILFRNILCPQEMLPSLRSSRNIVGSNVSATMCPRLPGPQEWKLIRN